MATIEHQLEILQAYKEGKTIVFKSAYPKIVPKDWLILPCFYPDHYNFAFQDFEYRVLPTTKDYTISLEEDEQQVLLTWLKGTSIFSKTLIRAIDKLKEALEE